MALISPHHALLYSLDWYGQNAESGACDTSLKPLLRYRFTVAAVIRTVCREARSFVA